MEGPVMKVYIMIQTNKQINHVLEGSDSFMRIHIEDAKVSMAKK